MTATPRSPTTPTATPAAAGTTDPRVVRPERSRSAAPGRFAHLRSLDGLRGLAVVLVVLSHFSPDLAPGGFLGVDLFFVLSGFLITSLLVTEQESSGSISLGNFWVRRAKRLFPALLLLVTAVVVATWVTDTTDQTHRVGADGLSSLLYVANWRFILSGQSYIRQFLDVAPSPLRHTWSLAIEEQFYILWPLVVIAMTALARRIGLRSHRDLRRWLTAVCVALSVSSLGWLVVLFHRGADLDRLYYGTDTRVFIILVGATLGAATAGAPTMPGSWRRARTALLVLGSVGLAGLVVATLSVTTEHRWLYAGGFGGVAIVLVVVLAAAAQPGPNPLARFLELRPLVGLGLISYGVYLWHWPITVWVTEEATGLDGMALFALRSALTLGVALLSYRYLEQPIRHGWLPRLGPIGPRFTAGLIVAGVLVSLAIPVVAFDGVADVPDDAPVGEEALSATSAYERSHRCDGPLDERPIRPGERMVVQLEGNSIAGEIDPCLRTILDSRGVDIVRVDPPGFLLCRELPAIEEQVTEIEPQAAVVFLFAAYDDRCGLPWHEKIDDLLDIYRRHGVHAYLVPSVPIIEGARDDLAPGPLQEDEYYRQVAQERPEEVTFVDAGVFLRGEDDEYRWRMPCLSTGEPGCDESGTVGVRFVDGLHFCTDPGFGATGCGSEHQAGERRAAAAIAATVVPSLEERFG